METFGPKRQACNKRRDQRLGFMLLLKCAKWKYARNRTKCMQERAYWK